MMADPSALSLAMMGVQFLMGLLVLVIGFVMRGVIVDLKEVSKELKAFQLSIVKDALMASTFETYRQETRQRLHDLGDRLGVVEGKISLRNINMEPSK